MPTLPPIVLTGSVSFDRIMVFPGRFSEVIQPDKLHVLSISVLLDELKESRGGVAANIAYALALLAEQPILYASVGENARAYMGELAELGVQTQHVHYSKLPTATFTVMTDRDDCQVGGFYPGAMSDAQGLKLKQFQAQHPLVVISPHDPAQMARQVAECHSLSLPMVYDIGQQVSNVSADDLRAGVEAAQVLIVNDYEMGVLMAKTGWSHAAISKRVPVVVVTLGAQGCEVFTKGQKKPTKIAAVRATQVVDPTGAGDAFRAGFLYGYIRDWPLTKSAQLGAAVAAYAVEQTGTQGYHFTMDELATRFAAAFGARPW